MPADRPDEDADWRGLDPALLTLRRAECALLLLPGSVAALALGLLVRPRAGEVLLAAVVALAVVLLLGVRRRFLAWGYLEREDDLLVRRGVLLQTTSVVPYGRMQFVDVTAGPLDRRFGLAAVVIHTAALGHEVTIPGLPSAEAVRLRDRLARLGEARAAGV